MISVLKGFCKRFLTALGLDEEVDEDEGNSKTIHQNESEFTEPGDEEATESLENSREVKKLKAASSAFLKTRQKQKTNTPKMEKLKRKILDWEGYFLF